MRDEDLVRTRMLLKRWGDWSNNDTQCSWYREMPGLKNVEPTTREIKETLCDEDALVIDAMIASMYDENNPRPMTFFILHYVYGLSKYEISRRTAKSGKSYKCSEGKVRSTLLLMESFVCGMLMFRVRMGLPLVTSDYKVDNLTLDKTNQLLK